jgi:hypothetical protein
MSRKQYPHPAILKKGSWQSGPDVPPKPVKTIVQVKRMLGKIYKEQAVSNTSCQIGAG